MYGKLKFGMRKIEWLVSVGWLWRW